MGNLKIQDLRLVEGKIKVVLERKLEEEEIYELLGDYEYEDVQELKQDLLEWLFDDIKEEIHYISRHKGGVPYEDCIDWNINIIDQDGYERNWVSDYLL